MMFLDLLTFNGLKPFLKKIKNGEIVPNAIHNDSRFVRTVVKKYISWQLQNMWVCVCILKIMMKTNQPTTFVCTFRLISIIMLNTLLV